MEPQRKGWLIFIASLGLLLLTAGIYWPVSGNEFVNYDDPVYVTKNAHVQSGLNTENIKWAFTTGEGGNWHPLTWISHMIDCQLYELKAAGHHATNLVFHIVNVLLLFWALQRMTGATGASAVVAGLFAWHPLHVESVAWVSERKDVLSTFFFLLSILAYACYAQGRREQECGAKAGGKTGMFYGLALGCFLLGLLAKPMVVTLPFVLLLLDYWPLRRLRLGEKRFPTQLVWEKTPFFVLAAASSWITYLVQNKGGAVSTLENFPMIDRVGNAIVSYVRYLGKTVWPTKLAVLYPYHDPWPIWQVGACFLVLAIFSFAVWRVRRPYVMVGWLWFLGTLVPVIGLVAIGLHAMADRYTYIPLIGIFIAMVWGAAEIGRYWPKWILALAAGATLAGCAMITRAQLGYWRNSETLFRHAIAVTEKNYVAYNNLANALSEQGRTEEVLENFREALRIAPGDSEAHVNLGILLARQGKLEEAIDHYRAAVSIKPRDAQAHNNLAIALISIGKREEAAEHFEEAVKAQPDYAIAHNNLGNVLMDLGRESEAVEHYRTALKLNPGNADAHFNLGMVLLRQKKSDEAIQEFMEALRQNPKHREAQRQLNALVGSQR